MEKKLETLVGNWYGRMEDIGYELRLLGLDVIDSNDEYIVADYTDEDGDDVQVMVKLGGTPSTITIESIEEVYRG